MTTGRRFRYQLESVLRKHESEMEQLRHRQTEVKLRMDTCARELDAVREEVAQTETQLRGMSREGAPIDPDQQSRLKMYLKVLNTDMEKKKEKLQVVEREYDDVCAQVRTAQKEIKTLEKHRAGRRSEFDTYWSRKDQTAADELWLLRRPSKRQS
jgi:chromosome segregation ATPase